MSRRSAPTASVIITAHAEGILIHRTLASVRRAIEQLPDGQTAEIILHVDNPTKDTREYIDAHRSSTLKDVIIFTNSLGDLGASRNFAISKATGKYVATIDADDLMSRDWLKNAVQLLESRKEPTIAHSEYTVEFEGADSLVIKHGEIDYATDTLLSVFANRWNSVIVAPRALLMRYLYTPNSPGYGYEDWNLNSRLIHDGIHNMLVPETAIFVRRKIDNSEWARQVQTMSVLRANPLLSFANIRQIIDPFRPADTSSSKKLVAVRRRSAVASAKTLLNRYPLVHSTARRLKHALLQREQLPIPAGEPRVAPWLQDEWKQLHTIDQQVFLSQHLLESIPVYDTLTEDHRRAGSLYKELVDHLRFDHYAYFIFVPWLTRGGADKYTIEYANTIAQLTDKPVLVIATLPVDSPWRSLLDDGVDFLDFGTITQHTSDMIRHRLMEHLVENSGVKALHVINSEFGYDFIRQHKLYITSSDKRVVITSFSQSLDPTTNRIYGYSHTHVPYVYEIADLVTSDNQAVIDMWAERYGFDRRKLAVHRQPMIAGTGLSLASHQPLRILWAGRIAPEKLPELALAIGRQLGARVTIDMYGARDADSRKLLSALPPNVTYRGTYDGFDSLPIDQYDMLLYTSLFDGMPNVILEAAAAGLPIVTSGVGGIPEVIVDGKSGFVITSINDVESYCQAINRIIDEPETGSRLAAGARAAIKKNFSRTQYTRSVRTMLQQLGLIS